MGASTHPTSLPRLKRALDLVKKFPWAPSLYFRYRNDAGELGEMVRAMEKRYLGEMARHWAKYHGSAPSEAGVHIASYLKLGLLFGYASEIQFWQKGSGPQQEEHLLAAMTEFVTKGFAFKGKDQ